MNEMPLKARVLMECLPFIKKFHSKIILIKVGGSILNNTELQISIMNDVAALKMVGLNPIIVHGGGKSISNLLDILNIESSFKNSLRVSPKEVVVAAEMALNIINKNLCAFLSINGVKSIGICGKDSNLLLCSMLDEGLGFVGKIDSINTDFINELLKLNIIPVISPIGMDNDGNTFNINADSVALELVKHMGIEKLIFLSDVDGIYRDFNDKSSLISEINTQDLENIVPTLSGGMHIKAQTCIKALYSGAKYVHIISGIKKASLLIECLSNDGIGTMIFKKDNNE